MHNGELTLTKLSSMSGSLLGRSPADMSTSMLPLKGGAWRQVRTADKQTNCQPLLLTSYWLTERNWSNCILCSKKRRLLFNSSDVALAFLFNTYVWGQIELESCMLKSPNCVAIWHWQSITQKWLSRGSNSAHNHGAVAFTTYRVRSPSGCAVLTETSIAVSSMILKTLLILHSKKATYAYTGGDSIQVFEYDSYYMSSWEPEPTVVARQPLLSRMLYIIAQSTVMSFDEDCLCSNCMSVLFLKTCLSVLPGIL